MRVALIRAFCCFSLVVVRFCEVCIVFSVVFDRFCKVFAVFTEFSQVLGGFCRGPLAAVEDMVK